MENDKGFFADVQQRLERYAEDRLLLLKLQATEKVADFSPKLILTIALAFVGFFIMLFASLLLGYYLTLLTGSFFYGFGIILFLYLLVFFLLIIFYKKYFKKYMTDLVVKMIFSDSKTEVIND